MMLKDEGQALWGEWLRTKDAARYCGLAEDTLYHLSSAEAITTYRTPGKGKPGTGALLFKRTDLDEYISRFKKEAIA